MLKRRSLDQAIPSSKAQPKKGSVGISQYSIEDPAARPAPSMEEERFTQLKHGKKTLTREVLCEAFKLELSPPFLAKFFELLKIDGDVDFAAFQRVVKVLESASHVERQKLAFNMFEPNSQSRVTKKEFTKVVTDLMCGSTKATPTVLANSSLQTTLKPVAQSVTDAVFSIYCSDEAKGMDYKEWLSFASEDPETGRILAALDRRIQWQETTIRKRYFV